MKIPKLAPENIESCLNTLCAIAATDCKELTCSECVFSRYNMATKKSKSEMIKQLNIYTAHLKLVL